MTPATDILTIHFGSLEALTIAALVYYFGAWVKKKVSVLQRLSVASPVVGGIIVAVTLSLLQGFDIARVTFDPTMQKQLMIAFFTTIGLMASIKVVRKGGIMLAFFLVAVTGLTIMQNVLGMSVATLLDINPQYGIMVGSVSLMGGLGTSAAFGPYFEQTYGLTGATAVAITSATLAMTNSLLIGGPIGEWLIKRYKVKTPDMTRKEISQTTHVDPVDLHKDGRSWTSDILKALTVILICMSMGKLISEELGAYLTLPVYIGSMIAAAIFRNVSDYFGFFNENDKATNAIAEISLALFVTMAIVSLKLNELVHLALPLLTIWLCQLALLLAFAWGVLFNLFGRNYDAVMLTVGGCGFCMGSTSTGLTNMQGLGEKYGHNPKAWLVVSLVGAFLIDFINALTITWFGTL